MAEKVATVSASDPAVRAATLRGATEREGRPVTEACSAVMAAPAAPDFAAAKAATAWHYAANIMPRCRALSAQVTGGAASIMALDDRLL